MKELLDKLKRQNILVNLEKGDLKIKFNGSKLPDNALVELKANKAEIVHYLLHHHKSNDHEEIIAVERRDRYPLSSSQRRLWILSTVDAGNVAYNMTETMVFNGSLNIKALRFAFSSVIKRHEILRTVFRDTDGEVSQFVLEPEDLSFFIPLVDLTGHKSRGMLSEKLKEEMDTPVDLENGPLIKAILYRLEENQFLLYYSLHHIVCDGWSIKVLTRELLFYYDAYQKTKFEFQPPLNIHYKDFAVAQQDQLNSGRLNQQLNYWKKQFEHPAPVLDLPSDRIRPAVKTYNGAEIVKMIGKKAIDEFRTLCREQGCTLFMGLLALTKTLFYRYTGIEDITIGSPISGRDYPELHDQIGFYVNTLALRTQFQGSDSFGQILSNVKETTLDAYEHQAYPFDELVSVLQQKRDVSRNPLFDVMLVLLNATFDLSSENAEMAGDELSSAAFEGFKRTSALFDLRLSFKEKAYGLDALFEYNSDIFNEERVVRMFDHFVGMMGAVISEPDLPIHDLNYISEKEYESINEFNQTDHGFRSGATLTDLFHEQVRLWPSKVAAVFKNETLTYSQLDNRANQLANFLARQPGLNKSNVVAVMTSRGFNQLTAMLAILKSGSAYLPVDSEYPEDRLLYMIDNAGVSVLIIEKSAIELGNRLLWRSEGLTSLVCVDSDDFYQEMGAQNNVLMSRDMWDAVGETASNEISGGGWMSSYTGEYFSEEEMLEYSLNILQKLTPFLSKSMKVLEIGCSSGITMFQIAPLVGSYHATDLSSTILKRTKQTAEAKGLTNITFEVLAAHDIGRILEGEFDLVIINSVIHCFNGLNYLRDVLKKIIPLMKEKGIVFLGDLMDADRKADLITDMREFKKANIGRGYRTKVDWSKELFVPRNYLYSLINDNIGFNELSCTEKIGTLSNELTKFRYDALLKVNKDSYKNPGSAPSASTKSVFSLKDIHSFTNDPIMHANFSAESLAYVIYTSGSTGRPKGCMLEHRGVVNRIEWMWSRYGFDQDDVILQKTSVTFDVSVWEFFLPLCFGAKMVICEKNDIASPARIRELIIEHRVTCLHFVPGMLNVFINYLSDDNVLAAGCQSLKKVFSSGEALPLSTTKAWFNTFDIPLLNLYGPTEASVDVTYYDVDRACQKVLIGKPIWNNQILITDEYLRIVPIGIDGEICVTGISLARGYAGDERATTEKFINNTPGRPARLYKTGDLGRWHPDGNIEYRGRKDQQIKIRGHRVELGEVEHMLKMHPDIENVAVIARPDQYGDTELIAYVVCREEINHASLRSFLASFLPVYMVPAVYIQLDSLPTLSNGKTDRNALPATAGSVLLPGSGYCPPDTPIEKELVSILEEILNRKQISVLDDFFEIGGDSFKAIRVAAKFARGLSLMDVYKHSKIRDLAKFLSQDTSGGILKLLTEETLEAQATIIVIPYGGGDPIGYQRVAMEIAARKDVAVYCLAMPRVAVDTSRTDFFEEMDTVVSKIVSEIKIRVSTPITIYTKCVAGGFGLEITRRLEQERLPVTALCIGGAMALTQNPWFGPVFPSNDERISLLRRIGATVPDDIADQGAFCQNVNFDIAVNLAAYTHLMQHIDSGAYDRLDTPLYCIIGTEDQTTNDYQNRFESWLYYAKRVTLKIIDGVGHYFSRDKPEELAKILYDISLPATTEASNNDHIE